MVGARDVTEQKRAEAALRESEERYRGLFEIESDAILMLDCASGRFLDVNTAASNLYGYTRDEFLGLRVGDISAEPEKTYAAIADHEAEIHLRWHRKKDGTVFPVDIAGSYFDCQGRHLHVAAIRDVTERKQADQALKASEAKYRRLYESMRDAYVSIAMDGHIQECNTAYVEMLGYTREELRSIAHADLTPAKWHATEAQIVAQQILPCGYSDIYEKEYRRRDGTTFPVELRTFLLQDDAGHPCGMWAIVRDITDRKRVETAMQESEARY